MEAEKKLSCSVKLSWSVNNLSPPLLLDSGIYLGVNMLLKLDREGMLMGK